MASSDGTVSQLKSLYHAYRHTEDLDRKGVYFSPSCMQVCRPTPSYAATTREQIVQYLRDAQQGIVPVEKPPTSVSDQVSGSETESQKNSHKSARNVYTIRVLDPSERTFADDSIVAHAGMTSQGLHLKSDKEKWVGMRVDLWDEHGPMESLLVKVQYWWRYELVKSGEEVEGDINGHGWRQCMHDIMYLGPKDGTEGKQEGLEVLE
ncbi:hypothetical protein BDV95DRAFT_584447 [Massariosphaeria phaeospora]|uniref:SnoaL-like domain-containing protein n=1 Tax=Massariosphaeria phaeospora TaxID=100035 RepID=A0A7C8M337_9PLEO|nr:hypothetical protein BDV95DRAFT_584447 [Massariosphaeria phaeospora]